MDAEDPQMQRDSRKDNPGIPGLPYELYAKWPTHATMSLCKLKGGGVTERTLLVGGLVSVWTVAVTFSIKVRRSLVQIVLADIWNLTSGVDQ